LLLLQAAVIYALYLNADFFAQSAEDLVSGDAAWAVGGMAVLVRIKTHSGRLLGSIVMRKLLTVSDYAAGRAVCARRRS